MPNPNLNPSPSPNPHQARQDKKLAGAVASVVELYDKFAAGFADKAGAPPQTVEEGSEHAYLMAHFHKARPTLSPNP